MKYRIDTHMHTTASDGTLNPSELLEEIKEEKIEVFSITDHDSIDNIAEMNELIENEDDIIFIPGVEISVTYMDKEVHLLTYGNNINLENKELMAILKTNQSIRYEFEDKYMTYISNKFNFTMKEYYNYERNPKEGGWTGFNFLSNKGIITSLEDIFKLIRESKIPFLFKKPIEILPVLKKLGFIVILAHPPAYYNGENLSKEFLDHFRSLGIDGIECYSPYYNHLSEAEYYTDYCKEHDLLIMSGSDYHGSFTPNRKLGKPDRYISDKSLSRLLNMIEQ